MDYMARALQIAARAVGTCSPNPPVGAVLVRDGEVVGEGATQPPGQAHAEIVALRAAGPRARGSTLYVTFEPCAHFGRTPPCADALIAAGVAEVHVAMLDPSPWVDGRGRAALEQAGVRVSLGSHEAEARLLYEPYLTWVLRGRPLVTGIYALDLDGRARCPATAHLPDAARSELERLRARADRTVSAVGDLLAGDPSLTGLASAGVTALNVEATPAALRGLAERGLLDRVAVFLTPRLGTGWHSPTDDSSPAGPAASRRPAALPTALSRVAYERLGDTVVITGYLPPVREQGSE